MQLIGLQLWTPVKWDVLKKSNLRQTELDQGSSLHHPNVCIFTTMQGKNKRLVDVYSDDVDVDAGPTELAWDIDI